MALVRAQCSFPSAGADTEDTVVNTWYFDVDTADVAGVANAQAALDTFYTSLITWLSNLQSWSNGRIKWYRMSDPEPRAPFAEGTFVISGTAANTALPPECCACLSFQGSKVSGASQARRRGRVYLGPIASGTVGTATGLFTTTFVNAVVAAADTLLAGSGIGDWTWVIYSRTNGSSVLVDNGWVDNAVDIQRRRGLDATVRTVFQN